MSPEGEEMQTTTPDATPHAGKLSTVATGALIISVGTLLSRLLGLVRENMISHYFGTSYIAAAFRTAAGIPDLLYYLLAGGALSAAFIPVFAEYLLRGTREDTNTIGSSILNLMTIALVVGVGLEMIFAPAVTHFAAPGYVVGSPTFVLAVALTRLMCAIVIFTAISGLLTGMLNSYHHFFIPTVVWIVYNLSIIFGIVVLRHLQWQGAPLGIYGVAISLVIGAIAMAVLQLPMVWKYGFRYRWKTDLSHPGVKRVLQLFAPVMIGLSLIQYNLQFIPTQIASHAGETAVPLIYNANRIVLLPMGIFAVAIATAAFPRLSQLASIGDLQALRATFAKSFLAIMLLIVPSAIGIYLLAKPVTCLLWGGGAFKLDDVTASAYALSLFIWGLLGLSLLQLVNRAFYALKDTLTPVIIGVMMVAANYLFGLYLTTHTAVDFAGTALATSITTTLATLALYELLRRKMHGIDGRRTLITTLKMAVAGAVMGGVIFLLAGHLAPAITDGAQRMVIGPQATLSLVAPHIQRVKDLVTPAEHLAVPRMRLLLQVAVSMGAGMLAYLLVLWLLGVQEVTALSDRIVGRFRRKTVVPTT